MAKLGSKKRPLILRVANDENARVAAAICQHQGLHFILEIAPDQPEDLRDLDRALRREGKGSMLGDLVPFFERFPDLADVETRCLTVTREDTVLPKDTYAFVEHYCVDPACDCRRVMLAVLSKRQQMQVATINYAFDPPADGDGELEQIFLDPLNPQSDLSPALLALFGAILLPDQAYLRRLERHYHLMKGAGVVRRIVAPATAAPLRRSLPPDERSREANRRRRQRQKDRQLRR